MPHITTRGIILKRRNMGEADRLITIYTERLGKIKAKARGVRKPLSKLAGHLEPLTESMLGLAEGKTFYTLTEATTIEIFSELRQDLEKAGAAFFVADLIDQLTEEAHRQDQVYQLFKETLELLNKNQSDLLLPAFVWRLLAFSGYKPELHYCVEGREKLEPDNIFFSFELGGLVDSEHLFKDPEAIKLKPDTVKLLRITLANFDLIKRLNPSLEIINEYSMVVEKYSRILLEKPPKSLKFLNEVRGSKMANVL